jgi:predicted metalloprotease
MNKIIDKIKKALKPKNGIVDTDWKDIAKNQAYRGDIQEALNTTNWITEPYVKCQALTEIAKEQAKAGGILQALETGDIEEALEAVSRIDDDYSKSEAYRDIAFKYIENSKEVK